ncbi:MAG: DUF1788 domain-containing protein [Acidobacteriales bacterium]|nr:DUF1788 domain-containing protein [Terriglobales bacterium]
MTDPLNERLNKILPRVISDSFRNGSGIGNEIGFYIFDYPPEEELRVRDYLRTLLEHIPKQKHGLRVLHVNLFDFVMEYLKGRHLLDKAIQMQREKGDEALKKALAGPLHETKMSSVFAEATQPEQHDLVIVSGVGMHLARGERSMLDAFQSAVKIVSVQEVGILVPLYDFYASIESFLDTAVKKTIDQAVTNPSLEPFDIQLIQVLFLIRYVDEMKGNVDTLFGG